MYTSGQGHPTPCPPTDTYTKSISPTFRLVQMDGPTDIPTDGWMKLLRVTCPQLKIWAAPPKGLKPVLSHIEKFLLLPLLFEQQPQRAVKHR